MTDQDTKHLINKQPSFSSDKTIKKSSKFHPGEDAEKFNAAIKGLGTDEKALIELITSRPREHLQKVKAAYSIKYGRTLEDDVKADTSGNFQDILVALMTDRTIYMAQLIRKAVKGVGTNNSILTEILCTQSNRRLKNIQMAYAQEFGRSLAADVLDAVGGETKALYALLLQCNRPDDEDETSQEQTKTDAKLLYDYGEGKLGKEDNTYIQLIVKRSRKHMEAVGKAYEDMYGHTLLTAIQKETSGHFRKSLQALVTPLPAYWAYRVHKAVQGLGTNNSALIRYFCMLTKEDLKTANAVYTKKHSKTFKQDLVQEYSVTHSNYGKVLLRIVPEEESDNATPTHTHGTK